METRLISFWKWLQQVTVIMLVLTLTSAGDGIAACVEFKVIEIQCLQPAPNQSLSLTSKTAKDIRGSEGDI